MSKTIVVNAKPANITPIAAGMVAKFSSSEVNQAVAATSLPPALQGVDVWRGSKDVGGNPAAHLAAINGKAQTIGLCQAFADFHFGSEKRAAILAGIKNKAVRAAFDAATLDYIRVHGKPLDAETMLEFLKGFVRASMESARVAAPVEPAKVTNKDETTTEVKDETTTETAPEVKDDAPALVKSKAVTVAGIEYDDMDHALKQLEFLSYLFADLSEAAESGKGAMLKVRHILAGHTLRKSA